MFSVPFTLGGDSISILPLAHTHCTDRSHVATFVGPGAVQFGLTSSTTLIHRSVSR